MSNQYDDEDVNFKMINFINNVVLPLPDDPTINIRKLLGIHDACKLLVFNL